MHSDNELRHNKTRQYISKGENGLLGTRGKGIEQKVLGFTEGLEPVLKRLAHLPGTGTSIDFLTSVQILRH
jgi:hypothetical protein